MEGHPPGKQGSGVGGLLFTVYHLYRLNSFYRVGILLTYYKIHVFSSLFRYVYRFITALFVTGKKGKNPSVPQEGELVRDFPGGPAVKTPRSQSRQPRFDPRAGN